MAKRSELRDFNGDIVTIGVPVNQEGQSDNQEITDYSVFIGKWVKSTFTSGLLITNNKWYPIVMIDKDCVYFTCDNGYNNHCRIDSFGEYFDLSNPKDHNPDEPQKILVPKEIGIVESGSTLMLLFGENQNLFVSKSEKSYWVGSGINKRIQCELLKCDRTELKKGDLAFRSDEESSDFDNLSNYCVVINESEHAYVNEDKSIYCVEARWKHWYKVIPVKQS